MPLTKLRFLSNHWDTMPTDPTKQNPMPNPKHTPWERNNCQFWVTNEVVIRASVSNIVPMFKTRRVETFWLRYVANGDTNMAQEMLRPPTSAYSRAVVPGKMLLER